jgi:hypothetical protein
MAAGVIIAIPTIAPDEKDQLQDLRKSVRRVHKSVPAHSPVRQVSADLSSRLEQLHRRGIPLYDLAEVVGLSHQAVRVRVRAAAQSVEPPTKSKIHGVPTLKKPSPGVVLVADAGVHRRLHIFDPPEEAGPAYLAMIPEIPLLEDRELITTWLESVSDSPPVTASSAATRLRDPAAVYLPREMLRSVLVPLTSEESDAERPAAQA